jgi:hypothetical protein
LRYRLLLAGRCRADVNDDLEAIAGKADFVGLGDDAARQLRFLCADQVS